MEIHHIYPKIGIRLLYYGRNLKTGTIQKLVFQFNQITLDTALYCLYESGNRKSIEPQVFDLLVYLIENRDRVVTRDEALENLWKGKVVTDSALGARLKAARKAVSDSGDRQQVIKTIHGRGYQFVSPVTEISAETEKVEQTNTDLNRSNQVSTITPSIAVLPFQNMSGDPEQDYFADGITEDIITELSRFRSLFVIARNSSFAFKGKAIDVTEVGKKLNVQFVVEGSVRKAGERIRITAQLIETNTGKNLWAERYDRNLDDIFEVQDEVATQIVTKVPGHVDMANRVQAERKPVQDMNAYDLVLRAENILYRNLGSRVGEKLLKQVLEIEPTYVRAHAMLSNFYAYSIFTHGLKVDEATALSRTHGEMALKLDPNDPRVHAQLADSYLLVGEHALASHHIDKAIALNPNDYLVMGLAAEVKAYLGDYQEAVKWANRALLSDPYSVDAFRECFFDAHYIGGQYELALEQLIGWQDHPPHIFLEKAVALAQLNRMEEADEAIQQFEKNRPKGWNMTEVIRAHAKMCAKPEDGERWIEGYRKAGLDV
jgi:adenylate cyclase